MISFATILSGIITAMLMCDLSKDKCIIFDFSQPDSLQPSDWIILTDKVRGGKSSASIYSSEYNNSGIAVFSYDLVPLPNGACFAGVKFDIRMHTWNLTGFDGIDLKLRRTGNNQWFKIIFDQCYAYEHQFQAPENWEVVRLPFVSFKPYHWGKPVQTDRPLNTTTLDFGIQMFGGVFEDFRQSGNGSLEIEWVRAYKKSTTNNV